MTVRQYTSFRFLLIWGISMFIWGLCRPFLTGKTRSSCRQSSSVPRSFRCSIFTIPTSNVSTCDVCFSKLSISFLGLLQTVTELDTIFEFRRFLAFHFVFSHPYTLYFRRSMSNEKFDSHQNSILSCKRYKLTIWSLQLHLMK